MNKNTTFGPLCARTHLAPQLKSLKRAVFCPMIQFSTIPASIPFFPLTIKINFELFQHRIDNHSPHCILKFLCLQFEIYLGSVFFCFLGEHVFALECYCLFLCRGFVDYFEKVVLYEALFYSFYLYFLMGLCPFWCLKLQ